MREVISKIVLDSYSFKVRVDVIKRSRSKPQHIKTVHAYITTVQGGYQVQTYTTVDRQMTEEGSKHIGDVYATHQEALPTLAGVFLGVLAAHEVYGDDIIGYLSFTANPERGLAKEGSS